MSAEAIERAFFGLDGDGISAEERSLKLANAPSWVHDAVARHQRAGENSTSQAPQPKRFVGWVAGCLAPGISRPCTAKRGETERLPEQLTTEAHGQLVAQGRRASSEVDLRWSHCGEPIVSAPLDLTFRLHKHPLIGACFEARLPEGEESERILDAIGDGGCGVSIGYVGKRSWRVERHELGEVRIVDACRLDHVALLPPDTSRPAYPAARAFACRSTGAGCPERLRDAAELFAWKVLKQQHGIG